MGTYLWRTRNEPHNIRVPVTRIHPAITKLQLFMPSVSLENIMLTEVMFGIKESQERYVTLGGT